VEALRAEMDLAIRLAEYESVRADPRRFAVAAGHVMTDVEEVVARTDRYVVVAKQEGTPAKIAVEQDPRA
jgi:5-bromo-4-chloroindolyl phosphate hydrolysis protein